MSFLVHVARTIPRNKLNQSILSQLHAAPQPGAPRAFSTSASAASPVTLWGGQALARSLRQSRSVLVTLQPISARKASSMRLHERDPDDFDGGHGESGGAAGGASGNDNNDGHGRHGDEGSGGAGDDGKRAAFNVIDSQLQKPSVPEVYPQVLAVPIAKRPLFPGFYKAVVVKDPHVTAAIKELLKRGQPYVGAFLLKDENLDVDTVTDINQVHKVGVFAQITSVFPASMGSGKDGKQQQQDGSAGLTAVLYPHRRIEITDILPPAAHRTGDPVASATQAKVTEEIKQETLTHDGKSETTYFDPSFTPETTELEGDVKADKKESTYATAFLAEEGNVSLANVVNLEEPPYSKKNQTVKAVTSEIVSVFKDIASLNPLFRDQIASFSMSQSAGNVFEEPGKLADFAAAVSAGEPEELQDVLETLPVEERLQKALLVLKKELMNAQLQNKISKEVESKIAKRQRDYYLMEQLKGIKKELGIESDGKDKLVEDFKEKAKKLAMPQAVQKVFDEVKTLIYGNRYVHWY